MLNVIIESLEDVDEAFRGEYEARDDKFVLSLNGAYSTLDRDKLMGSLQSERDDHKATKQKLTGFGEHTPEAIEGFTSRIEELEIAVEANGTSPEDQAKQAEKLEALAERKANARIKPLERKNEIVTTERDEARASLGTLQTTIDNDRIVNTVADPAVLKEAGVRMEAMEDVKPWALANFEIDDAGNVVSKKDGLGAKDVYADLKTAGQRVLWFGDTVGAGASGGRGGESFASNPFIGPKPNLTAISQAIGVDPTKAVRMAKAACTSDYDAMSFLPPSLRPDAK